MKLPLFAAVAAMLVLSSARAEEQVIPVPGEGWTLRFNAPQLAPPPVPGMGVFTGRAERLQLSLFVTPPMCAGGNTNEAIYKCFSAAMMKSPLVLWDTERGNTTPNGVQVMYMARLDTNAGAGKSFNIHLLFARNGKWADVHASIAAPAKDDIAALAAIVNSITIEDDAPAGQRTASP
jgi:opacity protein-like surface antigen